MREEIITRLEKIENVNAIIDGFMYRIKMYQSLVPELTRAGLYELAEKYDDRIDTCARAIGRLTIYKNKI
jgi:uncharacterized protein Yka (UPF0111/DUF47 family)